MQYTISGKSYNITRDDIFKFAKKRGPEPIDGRYKYYVTIYGSKYPIKQLLAGVTRLRNIAFTAQYAHRILTKLGFDVREYGNSALSNHFRSNASVTRDPDNGSQPSEEAQAKVKVHKFTVSLETDEDGFFVTSCSALPGCHSQGRTRQESLRNVTEAIRGYAASMEKHGEDVPDIDWEVVEVQL